MDCRLIRENLIAYHLAAAGEEQQREVEEHLVVCSGCLRDFLRLKHHIEAGAWLSQRPAPAVRQRLRRDVEAAFRPSASERMRQWLRTPIPLYQGLLAAALLLLVAGAAPALARWMASKDTTASSVEIIDTSRSTAAVMPLY